jgi:hypothetical protein
MATYTKISLKKQALPIVQESIQLGKKILEQKLAVYKNRLSRFEKAKHMDSSTFLRLFEQGELGDSKEFIEWEHVASVASLLQKKLDAMETIQYES